jgi:hypothetical protein
LKTSHQLKILPFVSIENKKLAEQFKNKAFTKKIVDVLDGCISKYVRSNFPILTK